MSIRSHHYIWSDTHLGHENILKYGQRPFQTPQEHDEHIIREIWKIPAHEVLWIAGDAAMNKNILDRLIGVPCTLGLIGGNHDGFSLNTYTKIFTHISGARVCESKKHGRIIVTHIPIHPDEFYRWSYNIHGHTHGREYKDKRYVSACPEIMGFTPKRIDDLIDTHLNKKPGEEN